MADLNLSYLTFPAGSPAIGSHLEANFQDITTWSNQIGTDNFETFTGSITWVMGVTTPAISITSSQSSTNELIALVHNGIINTGKSIFSITDNTTSSDSTISTLYINKAAQNNTNIMKVDLAGNTIFKIDGTGAVTTNTLTVANTITTTNATVNSTLKIGTAPTLTGDASYLYLSGASLSMAGRNIYCNDVEGRFFIGSRGNFNDALGLELPHASAQIRFGSGPQATALYRTGLYKLVIDGWGIPAVPPDYGCRLYAAYFHAYYSPATIEIAQSLGVSSIVYETNVANGWCTVIVTFMQGGTFPFGVANSYLPTWSEPRDTSVRPYSNNAVRVTFHRFSTDAVSVYLLAFVPFT